jgi:hypothetical protein
LAKIAEIIAGAESEFRGTVGFNTSIAFSFRGFAARSFPALEDWLKNHSPSGERRQGDLPHK